MGFESEQVIEACLKLGCKYTVLPSEQSEAVYSNIAKHFMTSLKAKWPLWEHFIQYSSRHDIEGWKKIGSFVKGCTILIFFEKQSDTRVVLLEDSSRLTDILGECTGFEIYVTSPEYDYLLCHNHHDMLIGLGTAREWINDMN